MNRRDFLKGSAMTAAVAALPGELRAAASDKFIWAHYLGMGRNMWGSWRAPDEPKEEGRRYAREIGSFNVENWKTITNHAAERKLNMVVIDIGESLRFPSHPELGLPGCWTPDQMREELRRLRGLGLEPIPKLNFSACHHAWLGEYSRMVSTRPYYQVCADLIRDLAEIFDHPRFMHLGYDEERYDMVKDQNLVLYRQGEAWWHDFLWFVKTVEDAGMRPWVWSDYGWRHDEYVKRCPKSVMQSNWYYDDDMGGFDPNDTRNPLQYILKLYIALEKAGFDQIPCGSNWVSEPRKQKGVQNTESMRELVKFCRDRIAPERLKGFFMAPWSNVETSAGVQHNCAGIDLLAELI